MEKRVSITNTTKGKLASLPFGSVVDAVLGRKYYISIVMCGNALSRRLNRSYRGKDKPTNVLSFPYSKNEGEIFLNLPLIERESRTWQLESFFKKNPSNVLRFKLHVLRLLIHGLLHLKGMQHGSRMEKEEIKFLRKFNFF